MIQNVRSEGKKNPHHHNVVSSFKLLVYVSNQCCLINTHLRIVISLRCNLAVLSSVLQHFMAAAVKEMHFRTRRAIIKFYEEHYANQHYPC